MQTWLEREINGIKMIYIAVGAAVLLFTVVLLRTAWVSDDAMITIRTVDNFVNGYGLVWNIGERVQSYTHALWLWLLVPVYAVTGNPMITLLALNILLSLAMVAVVVFKLAKTPLTALGAVLLFTTSKALTDYSTSGLENALSHLILAGFLVVFFTQESSRRRMFLLCLLAGFGMLTRPDALLFYAPALAYTLLTEFEWGYLPYVVLGFLPVVLWHGFTLFYYGFPFPNTAYAKLNTGIPKIELVQNAFFYYFMSLYIDWVTLPIIVAGLVLGFRVGWKERMVALGIVLYLLYVVNIGGDFMAGRFFSTAFVGAVILLAYAFPQDKQRAERLTLLVGALSVFSLLSPFAPLRAGPNYSTRIERLEGYATENGAGIIDERAAYHSCLHVIRYEQTTCGAALEVDTSDEFEVAVLIGFYGYFAGPEAYILDPLALTDALLARLPAEPQWRIGHFERLIPVGYRETIMSGENNIEHDDLAAYYDVLHLVISEDLLADGRLQAIWRLNTGYYEPLLESYIRDSYD